MLAVENEFPALAVHRSAGCYYADVSLRCQCDNFQCRIERISSVHLFEEFAGRAHKRNKNVADVLRKERSPRSREGENLQAMHYRSSMSMPSCIFHIVVDGMIVSRNRLKGGGVRICNCAAWSPENVADAEVLKPSGWHNGKTDRIEVAGLLGGAAGGRQETSGSGPPLPA
jgi:hypothetical protein